MREQPMSWFFEQEESTDGIAMRGDEEILEGISDQDVNNDISTKFMVLTVFRSLYETYAMNTKISLARS